MLADSASSSWEYLAEGNKHILFAYVGSNAELIGHVLYLVKINAETGESEDADAMRRDQAFSREIFQWYVGEEYVNVGEVVGVSSELLQALHESSSQGDIRPLARSSVSHISLGTKSGMLMKSCHFLSTGQLAPAGAPFTAELKPKKGILPTSHLLRDNCLAKRTHSGFTLKQRVKRRAWKEKAKEGAGPYELSGYEPLALFSGNKEQMKTTLDALVRNPMNNFRLFIGGKPVFDAEESDGRPNRRGEHMAEMEGVLLPFFGLDQTDDGGEGAAEASQVVKETELKQCKALKAVLYKILAQEPLLGRLKALQQLDVLDADGADLVYARALSLCGGGELQLLKLLDESERAPLPLVPQSTEGSAAPPLPLPPIQSSANSEDPAASSYGQQRDEWTRWTQQLALAECVQLLHHWRVSLAAADCSVMFTVQPVQLGSGGEDAAGKDVPQSVAAPGLATYKAKKGREVQLAYRLTVVDTGPKPISKLRRHLKQDEEMCRCFEEEEAAEREERRRQGCMFVRGWVFGMQPEELDKCYVRLTDELRRDKLRFICWDGDLHKHDSYTSLISRLIKDQEFRDVQYVAFKHQHAMYQLRKGFEADDYGVPAKGFDLKPSELAVFHSEACSSSEVGLFAKSTNEEDEDDGSIFQWADAVSKSPSSYQLHNCRMAVVGLPLAKKDFLGLSAEGLRFAKSVMGVTLATVMTFGEGYITRENLSQVDHVDQRDDYPRCKTIRVKTWRNGISGVEHAPLTAI
jgi:hypothetical protein